MLKATAIIVLLCLSGIAWSSEFEQEGGGIRGPRIMEVKTSSDCKQEKNWPMCADEDWGPKCPSGCRVAGLATQADKDFSKRIDAIKKNVKDSEVNYKSIDVTTKETYNIIKDNLVQGQQSDGKYNQVSENLRNKIEFMKKKVSNQVERIKALQRNIRDQVVNVKRLEVDIDIKLRSCKGSCAKNVNYHVDYDSYENIQKQLLQAESTDLRPDVNTPRVLKMRPSKDSTVDPRYKAQAQLNKQEKDLNIFSDLEQYSFVLERKQVIKCPSGCRVQGLMTKFGKEIMSRMDKAKQSCMWSNSSYLSSLPGIKQLHDVTEENMRKEQVAVRIFAEVGRELRTKLSDLQVKVKEQETKIKRLLNDLHEQLATMKRVEVDISLKLHSCEGSCQKIQFYNMNMDDYRIWKKYLDEMNPLNMIQTQNISHLNLYLFQNNVTNPTEPSIFRKEMQLGLLENIEQYVLKLEDDYNQTNSVMSFT